MTFDETENWIAGAAKRKDVRGLIRRAEEMHAKSRDFEYLTLIALFALEYNGLWRQVEEYAALTWAQFLNHIVAGYSAKKFKTAKGLYERFGAKIYRKYGYEILRTVDSHYGDRIAKAIDSLDEWVEDNSKLPTPPTVTRVLNQTFGNVVPPKAPRSKVNEWKERYEDAQKEIAYLRKESERKDREINDLRRRNARLERDLADANKKYEKVANRAMKELVAKRHK